ncbi:MAG TPA: hypothetical protein VF077_00430 [Nitrospiraceae bacterium]
MSLLRELVSLWPLCVYDAEKEQAKGQEQGDYHEGLDLHWHYRVDGEADDHRQERVDHNSF